MCLKGNSVDRITPWRRNMESWGREVQAGLTELEGGSWEGKPPLEGG